MKNNKKNILSKSDIKNLVFEAVGNGVQRVVSTAATRDNKAVQDAALKTAEEKVAALTPPTKGPTIPTVEYGAEANKGQERLKYDYINDKFKERVKALVLGKDSPLQKSIDPSSGVDIKGNEKFLQRAKELNKADQDNKGIAGNAVAQYGRQFQVLQGVKPKTDNNAFESKEMKNKVKVGDIFIENKNNLKLKVTGLSEDKSTVNFLEENTKKKYSLKIENFKTGVKNGKIIRESEIDFMTPSPDIPPLGYKIGDTIDGFMTNYSNHYSKVDDIDNGMVIFKHADGSSHKESTSYVNKEIKDGDLRVINTDDSDEGENVLPEGVDEFHKDENTPSDELKTTEFESKNMGKLNKLNELDYQQGRSPQVQSGNYKIGDKVLIYEIPSTITSVDNGLVTTEADRNGETSNWSTEEFNKALQSGDAQLTNESKMKQLRFSKTSFLSEDHMRTLIPEAYKVKGTKLSMIDNKNHQYIVEFNHNKEIFICEEKNPQKNDASLNRIKQLFEYKREEYLKPQAEILKENDAFTDILSTVRKLKEGK